MDLAVKAGAPFVGLNDGAGARIQKVVSLVGYGDVFTRMCSAGVNPADLGDHGPCAGGARLFPAMTDFNHQGYDTSNRGHTGPDVIKTLTHEEVSPEDLVGAIAHASKSCVADFAVTAKKSASR